MIDVRYPSPEHVDPPTVSGRSSTRPWLVSIVIHTFALLVLALWVLPKLSRQTIEQLSGAIANEEASETFSLAAASAQSAPTESKTEIEQAASPVQWTPTPLPQVTASEIRRDPNVVLASLQELVQPAESLVGNGKLPLVRDASDSDSIHQARGESGAIDAATGAIRGELLQGDTLVVWLLDASISLEQSRLSIARNAKDFYRSIDALNPASESTEQYQLLSSVIAFGKSWREVVKPTYMGARAIDAMVDLPLDTSGNENVMAAIQQAIDLYRGRRHHEQRLLLVVLTDEAGDDVAMLEETIDCCRDASVAVHVIGPTAVMGCRLGSQHCSIRKGGVNYSFWVTVNKGPESAAPERFFLPYWHESALAPWRQQGARALGHSQWYGGPYRERVPSGFGPYALTRLALQTGGTFTTFDGDRGAYGEGVYDLDALRDYVPDYRMESEYLASIQDSPLRQLVIDAAAISFQQQKFFLPPRMNFLGERSPYYPYNIQQLYFTPAEFRSRLSGAVREERARVNVASTHLEELVQRLNDTSIDWSNEYAQETSNRWRASFDLTKGRLLANQARYFEYLATTNSITSKVAATTNNVTLHAQDSLLDPRSKSLIETARTHLQRCVAENKSTPWEDLAAWELDKPFGLRIQENTIPQPAGTSISRPSRTPTSFSFPNL